MWQLTLEFVQLTSQIFTTVISAIGVWVAYRMLLKTPEQEIPVVVEDDDAVRLPNTEGRPAPQSLVVFDTKEQRSTLSATERGLECHLRDSRPGKASGVMWIVSKSEIPEVLGNHLWSVSPGLSLTTGKFSIGTSPAWQYSKNLFPEPRILEMHFLKLLEMAA